MAGVWSACASCWCGGCGWRGGGGERIWRAAAAVEEDRGLHRLNYIHGPCTNWSINPSYTVMNGWVNGDKPTYWNNGIEFTKSWFLRPLKVFSRKIPDWSVKSELFLCLFSGNCQGKAQVYREDFWWADGMTIYFNDYCKLHDVISCAEVKAVGLPVGVSFPYRYEGHWQNRPQTSRALQLRGDIRPTSAPGTEIAWYCTSHDWNLMSHECAVCHVICQPVYRGQCSVPTWITTQHWEARLQNRGRYPKEY